MQDSAQHKLRHLGESLLQPSGEGLSDSHVLQLLEAFEEQDLATSHLARLTSPAIGSSREQGAPRPAAAAAGNEPMRLVAKHILINADEHRCCPGEAQVQAGGTVRIAVSSGPPQSFEITGGAGQPSDETPRIPAGEHYDWRPAEPGTHTIASHVYPGCKARVTVRQPLQPGSSNSGLADVPASSTLTSRSAGSMSQQVDEPIRFPLGRTSRGSQTDPVASASRFTATTDAGTHLPPLRAFNPQAACTPASVLPGITSAAAAAVNGGSMAASSMFPSPEELEVYSQTGLRRRSSSSSSAISIGPQQRPGSAGSVGSAATAVYPRTATPDVGAGMGSRATPTAGEGLSATSSQGSSPRAAAAPIFRPVRNMSALQRSISPVSTHSSEETMPLLDIRMNNRVQHRPSSVFPTSGSRGALVSPTSAASRDATHKCPRCRKEYLSTINQRRCLAVHLGHKAGSGGGGSNGTKGSKGSGGMPDRTQLVEFWDGLTLPDKQAVLNLKAEAGSEAVLRNMEVRLLQRDSSAVTTEQRTMFAAGRTLFEVLVRGKGLESLSGEALATLLAKASEGTFLYDRALPARDESVVGYNAEAALSAFIVKRLVDALLSHRQQAAEKAQRELEELEEAQKGDKGKPAEKRKKEKKASKPKPKAKPGVAKADTLSRSSSMGSTVPSEPAEAEPSRAPAVEDSARLGKPQQPQQQAAVAKPATEQPAAGAAEAAALTPAKSTDGRSAAGDSDAELTPPPNQARYTPTEGERPAVSRQEAAAAVTYTNALYSAEGEGGSGSWQPAVKSGGRGGGAHAAGRTAAGADAPRSNGHLQQQPAAQKGAQHRPQHSAEHPAEARPAPKPAAAAAAGPSRGVRPATSTAPAKPAAEAPAAEAFPALPSKPSQQKGDAAPVAAGAPAAGDTDAAAAPTDAAPKAPVPGISYASAAKSVTVKQAQAAAAKQRSQQAPTAKPDASAGPAPAPTAAPQQQQQPAPAPAASAPEPAAPAPKLVQFLPVEPGKAQLPPSQVTAPEAPTSAAPVAAAEPPAAPAAAPVPVQPKAEPLAAVQQLLGPQQEADASVAAGPAPGLERSGAVSTTPPLEEGDMPPGLVGVPGGALPPLPPQDAPYPLPGYGCPPMGPPVGFCYYPMPALPAVQFGDVDMGEIIQQQLERHQCFFTGPPPPIPYAAAGMPPFAPPPLAGMPLHPVPPPAMGQAPLPGAGEAAPRPAPMAQEGPQQVEAQLAEAPPAPTSAQRAAAEVAEPAPAETAEPVADEPELATAEEATPPAPAQEAAEVSAAAPAAAPPAEQAAQAPAAQLTGPAEDAAAGSMHLESMLRAAASAAARQGPAFDPAAAARELAGRWEAAVAPAAPTVDAECDQPHPAEAAVPPPGSSRGSSGGSEKQQPLGASRSSSGGSEKQPPPRQAAVGGGGASSGAPARRGGAAKGEWRPVLKEQSQPVQATIQPGPLARAWGVKPEQLPGVLAAAQANGGSERLPFSFATVVGAAGKAGSGGDKPTTGTAVRGWSSDEAGDGAKWKIGAAK